MKKQSLIFYALLLCTLDIISMNSKSEEPPNKQTVTMDLTYKEYENAHKNPQDIILHKLTHEHNLSGIEIWHLKSVSATTVIDGEETQVFMTGYGPYTRLTIPQICQLIQFQEDQFNQSDNQRLAICLTYIPEAK